MQTNSLRVERLCGTAEFEALPALPSLPLFDTRVCSFLDKVSVLLLGDKANRAYPDVSTFAFFCRKGNIQRLREGYEPEMDKRTGRGVVFHIAPGNVPVNFAYSLVAGLLAGNACLVKAASNPFPQSTIIAGAMARAMDEGTFDELRPYVNIVRYGRENNQATEIFSALCDVRVVWGGDETISAVRKAPLMPRAFDITFADRCSLAVFTAQAVNAAGDSELQKLARDFYNDTYLYDQNACASPFLMYWLGKKQEVDRAKVRFWGAVHAAVAARYALQPVVAVNKRMAEDRCAIDFEEASVADMPDNLVRRVSVGTLLPNLPDYRCAGGFFIEYASETLDGLRDIISRKYQTVACFGPDIEAVRQWVRQAGLHGIDRVVPVGHSADFSLVWDGHDLIRSMSRVVG